MSENYFDYKVFNPDGSLKLLSDDIRNIVKDYIKDNLKIKLSSKKLLNTSKIELVVVLDGEIIAKHNTFI